MTSPIDTKRCRVEFQNGCEKVRFSESPLDPAAEVVHDGIEGVDYLSLASKYPGVERTGELLLYPGQTNKLRLLWDEGNTFTASRELSVTGVYRPRRLLV